MALATPRSRSAGVPRMISPPTLPHPNPRVDTVRPVLPTLRDSMESPRYGKLSHSSTTLEPDGDAVENFVTDQFRFRRRSLASREGAPPSVLHEPAPPEQLRVRAEPP